jgi:hypothetical protein
MQAARFEQAAVQMHDLAAAGAPVQVVDVLRDDTDPGLILSGAFS